MEAAAFIAEEANQHVYIFHNHGYSSIEGAIITRGTIRAAYLGSSVNMKGKLMTDRQNPLSVTFVHFSKPRIATYNSIENFHQKSLLQIRKELDSKMAQINEKQNSDINCTKVQVYFGRIDDDFKTK